MKKHLLIFVFSTALVAQDHVYITNAIPLNILWSNITAGQGFNLTNAIILAPENIDMAITNAAQSHTLSTNAINAICAYGEVCRVKGHFWRDGRPGESENLRYLDYHPDTSYRTCTLCGTVQSQTREWK